MGVIIIQFSDWLLWLANQKTEQNSHKMTLEARYFPKFLSVLDNYQGDEIHLEGGMMKSPTHNGAVSKSMANFY